MLLIHQSFSLTVPLRTFAPGNESHSIDLQKLAQISKLRYAPRTAQQMKSAAVSAGFSVISFIN